MKFQIYSYKQAREIMKSVRKKPVITDDNGITTCEIAFPFKLDKGQYVILMDKSYTDATTMKTKYEVRYGSYKVTGDSQEDCLLKLIAKLTKEILEHDKHE